VKSNLLDQLRSIPPDKLREVILNLPPKEAEALIYDWTLWARPEQIPPEEGFQTYLYVAGRGAGKTRMAAEWVRRKVDQEKAGRIALVAPTAADARDVLIEGESGILSISPPESRPEYQPSKRRIVWPNGAMAYTYSAEEPERLRGPQHDLAWCDEVGSWPSEDPMDMLMLGLRLGRNPQRMVTTTPKPTKLVKGLLKAPHTMIVRGSTYDNRANLAPIFFDQIVSKYEGTRLGRQELYAELLEDAAGALWTRDVLDANRVLKAPELVRIVVGIDPSMTAKSGSDEAGIVVGGKCEKGHAYIMRDSSFRASPDVWARKAINLYNEFKADRIIAEINNGGEMVELTLRTIDDDISYKGIHASRGKIARAEPVGALYEQGKVHHVGMFQELEDELCTFDPEANLPSPNRMDALVWAVTELMLGNVIPNVLPFSQVKKSLWRT